MAELSSNASGGLAQDGADFSDIEGSDDERIDVEEEVDPRVQGELETLNSASDEINTLETELEKSRNKFRALLADSTLRLNGLFKKTGKAVLKARPYYELSKSSRESQAEAQKAAVNFQRANSIYKAAKEMVQLAEERNFPEDGDKRAFDSAWQEMLNHATMKFMESEKEKADSEEHHLIKAAEYAAITQKLRFYEKDMPRTISRAKSYFDLKEKLERHLQMERMNVEDLQMGLMCAKHKYRSALTNLEAISEEIHQKRKKRLNLPPRTPGVGAESNCDLSSLPSVNLDNLSDTASFASMDDLDADGASLKGELPDYEKPGPPGVDSTCDTVVNKLKAADISSAGPSIGAREAVAEGSESIAHSSHQESPADKKSVLTYKSTVQLGPLAAPQPAIPQPGVSYYGKPNYHGYSSAPMATQGAGNMVAREVNGPHGANQATPTRREQKKLQTQMAFPILQGLTNSQRSIAPTMHKAYVGSAGYQSQPQASRVTSRQNTPGGAAVEEKAKSQGGASSKKEEVFV